MRCSRGWDSWRTRSPAWRHSSSATPSPSPGCSSTSASSEDVEAMIRLAPARPILVLLMLAIPAVTTAAEPEVARSRDYHFDGKISREVLENYLSRSITMEGLLNG